jgi:outer membrane protein TolC
MTKPVCCIVVCAVSFTASAADDGLTLKQVLRRAMAKPMSEDFDLEIATTRVQMLKAASHRRIELIPQAGLFSLTNPMALATNVGARLLTRPSDVPTGTLLEAEIAQLSAEIAGQRNKFQREMEVSRSFYDVLEQQSLAEYACAAIEEAEARRHKIVGQLSGGRLTRVDVLRLDQEILDREIECRRAEQHLQLSAARLSPWVNIQADQIHVAEPTGLLKFDDSLQPSASLLQVALTVRKQPSRFRETIDALRRQVDAMRPPGLFQFSLGYSRLGRNGLGGVNSSMFAGQGLQPEVSLRLGKDHGALGFEKQLLSLELSRLERGLDLLEKDLASRVSEMRGLFEARRGELTAARKRLTLAVELNRVMAARHRAGLETRAAVASAESSERQTRLVISRLEQQTHSALSVVLAVCGLLDEQPQRRLELIAARPEPVHTSFLH